MADNISVTDSAGAGKTARTTDTGSVHMPWHALGDVTGARSAGVNAHNNSDALATSSTLYSLLSGALGLVFNGVSWDRRRAPVIFKPLSAVVITSETTIWTPASGKKFRLMGGCLTQGVATGAVTLKDNTAGSTILVLPPHTIAVAKDFNLGELGILSGAADRVLTATGASTETLTGFIFGTEE